MLLSIVSLLPAAKHISMELRARKLRAAPAEVRPRKLRMAPAERVSMMLDALFVVQKHLLGRLRDTRADWAADAADAAALGLLADALAPCRHSLLLPLRLDLLEGDVPESVAGRVGLLQLENRAPRGKPAPWERWREQAARLEERATRLAAACPTLAFVHVRGTGLCGCMALEPFVRAFSARSALLFGDACLPLSRAEEVRLGVMCEVLDPWTRARARAWGSAESPFLQQRLRALLGAPSVRFENLSVVLCPQLLGELAACVRRGGVRGTLAYTAIDAQPREAYAHLGELEAALADPCCAPRELWFQPHSDGTDCARPGCHSEDACLPFLPARCACSGLTAAGFSVADLPSLAGWGLLERLFVEGSGEDNWAAPWFVRSLPRGLRRAEIASYMGAPDGGLVHLASLLLRSHPDAEVRLHLYNEHACDRQLLAGMLKQLWWGMLPRACSGRLVLECDTPALARAVGALRWSGRAPWTGARPRAGGARGLKSLLLERGVALEVRARG
jgi:hypothetical protein